MWQMVLKEVKAQEDLTGIWYSHYRYPSSGRGGEFEGVHYVRIYRKGRLLIAESLPKVNKSYLLIRLSLDGNIATGSWQEETDPNGYYKGAIYHGAIQLVVDKEHKRMKGTWTGFGKQMEVNVGPWELSYIGDTAGNETILKLVSA